MTPHIRLRTQNPSRSGRQPSMAVHTRDAHTFADRGFCSDSAIAAVSQQRRRHHNKHCVPLSPRFLSASPMLLHFHVSAPTLHHAHNQYHNQQSHGEGRPNQCQKGKACPVGQPKSSQTRARRELVVGPSRNLSGGLPLTGSWDLLRAPSQAKTLSRNTLSSLASWSPG